jgi:hypothetical protein
MNDYLWDRSGEPDPELEQLENLLRPLRYAPPAGGFVTPESPVAKRRIPTWGWAMAASVAIMAVALAIWVVQHPSPESLAFASSGDLGLTELNWSDKDEQSSTPGSVDVGTPPHLAQDRKGIRASRAVQNMYRIQAEEREGRLAAAQLLRALQITSDQLNMVKTKVRETGAPLPVS